jgi:hypothetical protein
MASVKVYRVVTSTPSVAHNIVSGTTAANTPPFSANDKGVEVTIQNQSTGNTNIYVGGSDLTISIGATSTTGVGGILLTPSDALTLGKRHAPSAIQMNDWYICSTSSLAVAVVHLLKAV